MGYEVKRISLTPRNTSGDLIIELAPTASEIEEVVLKAEQEDLMRISESTSKISLNPLN